MNTNEHLEKLSAERCSDMKVSITLNAATIFRSGDKFSSEDLYFARFQRIPNMTNLYDIDCKKANDWLVQNYQDKIIDCCYIKDYIRRKGVRIEYIYYFLFDDLLVFLDQDGKSVRFLYRKTDSAVVNQLVTEIEKFKKKKTRSKPTINLVVSSSRGLDTQSMDITRPKFSIEENYNDDFLQAHETILKRLRKNNDKGIVMLHGKPGTGKTSYIRYLITKTQKPVIFLPPNMATCITDPSLMNVLIDNPNSIFVIEDAENIVIDRNRNGASPVSAILNLADGLLSDCLNIQIICSFNTDLSRVDSALTRKGRLIAKYEFSELEVAKAQALSNKLGFRSFITSPMTLAAIYNQHETEFAETSLRRSMGFSIAV